MPMLYFLSCDFHHYGFLLFMQIYGTFFLSTHLQLFLFIYLFFRFWVSVRFQQLYFAQRFSRSPLVEEFVVSSGLIGWAFHSDCHDNLFNSLLSIEPSWEDMRSMGVGFWYTNVSQLRVKVWCEPMLKSRLDYYLLFLFFFTLT